MFLNTFSKNGILYAKACSNKRNEDGKVVRERDIYLGRVIDQTQMIFWSRKREYFIFNLSDGSYAAPPATFVPPAKERKNNNCHEKLILNFGDVYLINSYLKKTGLCSAIDAVEYKNPDTLYSMICFYIICSMANCYAEDWYEGSFARILYPKADLRSQRISEFLESIGEEVSYRHFFEEYHRILLGKKISMRNIIIDSTGLPNSVHFPYTAFSNHNGNIINEARLIYVVEQKSQLPIFFRYCPGNVIDGTTFAHTIAELKSQGIDTNFTLCDSGYYNDGNVDDLYENNITFMTRLGCNRKLYKDLISKYACSIEESNDNLISYNNRFVYVKTEPCMIGFKSQYKAYAYVCKDLGRKNDEERKLFIRAMRDKMSNSDVAEARKNLGMFVLISSDSIGKEHVLPLYYMRQQIEQIFDIGKNEANLLPLRSHNEKTFRGHLLLTFISTVIVKMMQETLRNSVLTPRSVLFNLANQKCKVYDNNIVTMEAFKKANDSYKAFGIECPVTIPL